MEARSGGLWDLRLLDMAEVVVMVIILIGNSVLKRLFIILKWNTLHLQSHTGCVVTSLGNRSISAKLVQENWKFFRNFIKIFQQPHQLISKCPSNFLKNACKSPPPRHSFSLRKLFKGGAGSLKIPAQGLSWFQGKLWKGFPRMDIFQICLSPQQTNPERHILKINYQKERILP